MRCGGRVEVEEEEEEEVKQKEQEEEVTAMLKKGPEGGIRIWQHLDNICCKKVGALYLQHIADPVI